MTLEQKQKLLALSGCTFPVGSYPKRFVRNLTGYTGVLTENQINYLDRLVYHYRKQIGSELWTRTQEGKEHFAKWVEDGRKKVQVEKIKRVSDEIKRNNRFIDMNK